MPGRVSPVELDSISFIREQQFYMWLDVVLLELTAASQGWQKFPFFHGKITRRTCEELLSKNGKNGSYLIRESESVEGALCLCIFFEEIIYTYRIFREHQGYFRIQTSEGVPAKIFRTLKDLIYNYEKPDQGLITNLRYPVEKQKASQRSQKFKSEKDEIYDEIDDSDYIAVLP